MVCVIRSWRVLLLALAAAVGGGWLGYVAWRPAQAPPADDTAAPAARGAAGALQSVRLTRQAQQNLALVSRPIKLTNYWRTVEIPGVIVDRPGVSKRRVVAPIAGVVTEIQRYPGDVVPPGAPLFTLRLVSESLHASQLELYKATREMEIARKQRQRLADLAQAGALARSRIIELENQLERMQALVEAHRQDLQARGIPAEGIDAVCQGTFVRELRIQAPGAEMVPAASAWPSASQAESGPLPFAFELQELLVTIGAQVEAGTALCVLADHRSLLIEGRGFKNDLPLVQAAARNGWQIEVEQERAAAGDWLPLPEKLHIRHIASSIDPESRTFAFYLALENQWQAYSRNGQPRLLWQFRPGDRVQLHVAVEKFEKVFVLPRQAVVREGPEAFVFRQNGSLFERRPVHVLHEDRRNVVLANDGSLREGFYFAQNAAAAIQRVLKAQAASGAAAHIHVHADGTVHAAH